MGMQNSTNNVQPHPQFEKLITELAAPIDAFSNQVVGESKLTTL